MVIAAQKLRVVTFENNVDVICTVDFENVVKNPQPSSVLMLVTEDSKIIIDALIVGVTSRML